MGASVSRATSAVTRAGQVWPAECKTNDGAPLRKRSKSSCPRQVLECTRALSHAMVEVASHLLATRHRLRNRSQARESAGRATGAPLSAIPGEADVDASRRSPQPRPVGRARAAASSGKPRKSAMRRLQKHRHGKGGPKGTISATTVRVVMSLYRADFERSGAVFCVLCLTDGPARPIGLIPITSGSL